MRDDDWDDELTRPDGYPLIALVIGGLATGAIAYFTVPMLGAMPLIRALAFGGAAAVGVWAVAWLLTLRHVGALRQWGVFLALVVAGMVGANLGNKASADQLRFDLATIVETRFNGTAGAVYPRAAEGRGPVSRLYVGYFRHFEEDASEMRAQIDQLRFRSMADARAVQADPTLIADCGRFNGLKDVAHATIERRIKRVQDTLAKVDALAIPEEARRNVRMAIEGGGTPKAFREMIVVEDTIFAEVTSLCGILARRRWKASGPMFMFNTPADLAEFRGHGVALNKAIVALQQIEFAAMQSHILAQRNLRKAFDL